MVTDLDFEEIDDLMGQMDDTKELTEAIAADVAKVSPKPKAKKAPKKSTPKSVKVEKPTLEPESKDDNPEDDGVVIAPKVKPVKKVSSVQAHDSQAEVEIEQPKVSKPKSAPKPEPTEEELDGTKVAVRVLTKYVDEPEEPVYKPNPKTGRYMDFVNPKGVVSVTKQQPKAIVPVMTVVETHETVIETVEEELPEEPENVMPEEQDDRERLERNGLDPDATVEEMMEQAEPEDGDEFLEELMNNLGDDIEEEPNQPDVDSAGKADILDYPDRTDAFLSEVDIEKRPLGGSAVASAMAIQEEKELAADKEFIEDKPSDKWLNGQGVSKKEQKKLAKEAKKQAKNAPVYSAPQKKKSKAGQALLYVALILLLAILGGSLGALAYFSGLF